MDRDYQTTMCFELAKTYAKGSAALNEAKEILTFIQQREKLTPGLNLGAQAQMESGGKKDWYS